MKLPTKLLDFFILLLMLQLPHTHTHRQAHIYTNNAIIYPAAKSAAVAWECVGRLHNTADRTRPFLTPQATSAELPTKMATFGPFCPFLHVTFSFRAPCKTLPEWPLGKYKLHCTRLRHKRPDIKVTEDCDSVVEDLFLFWCKDWWQFGWRFRWQNDSRVSHYHRVPSFVPMIVRQLFHFVKNTILDDI